MKKTFIHYQAPEARVFELLAEGPVAISGGAPLVDEVEALSIGEEYVWS